ncbi:MAG: matrixin family metalloprotease [Alphaproteobacteria bacterium]
MTETPQTVVSAFLLVDGPHYLNGAMQWSLATASYDNRILNPDGVFPETLLPALREAMARWSAVADVTFEQVADGPDVDLRIGFKSELTFQGETVFGMARSTFVEGFEFRADIMFDAETVWIPGFGDPPDIGPFEVPFLEVAQHEIGHILGLDHEDDVPAVMNTGVLTFPTFGLQDDDLAGISMIYSSPADADEQLIGSSALGASLDSLLGGGGDDSLWGLDGGDTLVGGSGADRVFGNQGADSLAGGDGDDLLKGHPGADQVFGGDGADLLFGGANDDTAYGGSDADTVNGNSGFDRVDGGTGNDIVRGQGGQDTLYGGAGNDTVLGMHGLDWLYGGDGNDLISGGLADDTIYGGAGADVFAAADGHGLEYIADFEDGIDIVSFVGVIDGFAGLTINAAPGGTRVTVVFPDDGPGLIVDILGIDPDQLSAADFVFG